MQLFNSSLENFSNSYWWLNNITQYDCNKPFKIYENYNSVLFILSVLYAFISIFVLFLGIFIKK